MFSAGWRLPRGYRGQRAEDCGVLSAGCLRDRPELIEIFRGNSRDDGQKARRGGILAQPVAADLSGFDRPTLLLARSEDRLIPNAETFAIARDLKRAETRVIEQVGHVSSIQAPERVAEAVIAFEFKRRVDKWEKTMADQARQCHSTKRR